MAGQEQELLVTVERKLPRSAGVKRMMAVSPAATSSPHLHPLGAISLTDFPEIAEVERSAGTEDGSDG